MKNTYNIIAIAILSISCSLSCNKENEWLDKKYQSTEIVPKTVSDFQMLLDNDGILNTGYPYLPLLSTDDVYYLPSGIPLATVAERNTYQWKSDIFEGGGNGEWNFPFRNIEYCNVVLEGLMKATITSSNQSIATNVKGSALFLRAYSYYYLTQIFGKPYDKTTAATDLAVPIRTTADVNVKPQRATVEEVYNFIITDLLEAINLLTTAPINKFRPSKQAALTLLAKVYLHKADYTNALKYSDLTLKEVSGLIDYNSLNTSLSFPFSSFITTNISSSSNPEVIFHTSTITYNGLRPNNIAYVDSVLFKSYNANDLRQQALFRVVTMIPNRVYYKGSFNGNILAFSGLSTAEVYFIKSESQARLNLLNEAAQTINTILIKRYKTGQYNAIVFSNQKTAIDFITEEKRKEFPFVGILRWEELRRLNKIPGSEKTLSRDINGVIVTLLPNDKKYTFPIPLVEIQLSGLVPNDR